MQLERLVQFHKALADPTRVRILALLARQALHGQALAGKLGLSPPTISHHIAKLREAGLIKERRMKNTVYFHLDPVALERKADAIVQLLQKEAKHMTPSAEQEILHHFFTPGGRLKNIPAQRKKRRVVLRHLLKEFEPGRKYTEKEVNDRLRKYHEDVATLRRELIIHHFMYRERGIYELNPPEMWT